MKRFALLLAGLILVSLSWCFGQIQKPFTKSLVVKFGSDTIVVDTYTINNNHLYGKAFIRFFENHIREYDVSFNPDGSIAKYYVSAMDPSNSSLPFKPNADYFPLHTDMMWADDTAYFSITRPNGEELKMNRPAPSIDFIGGWVPLFPLMDWNYLRLVRSGKRSLDNLRTTNMWDVTDLSIRYLNKDTLLFGGPFIHYSKIILGPDGISSINGIGSAYNFIITRTTPMDIDWLARRMAKAPAIVSPSPRETAHFDIHDNKIKIEYGRPFARGRVIFGGVVPFDSLWRTGANDPTLLTIEKGIKIGNSVVPKGTYAIYSIPRQKSWTLIFSRDLDSWPTNPDRTKEVAHTEMSTRKILQREQFTIEVSENKGKGLLKLSWGDREAYTEFVNVKE